MHWKRVETGSWVGSIIESRETSKKVWGVQSSCEEEELNWKRDWDVVEKGKNVEDADSSVGVQEVERGSVKYKQGDRESFEEDGRLLQIELEETDKKVDTGGEGILPADIGGSAGSRESDSPDRRR